MTAGNHQVVTMYEELRCTPEEIAHGLDLDLQAVILTLATNSKKYRLDKTKEQKGEDAKVVTGDVVLYQSDEVNEAAEVIASLMRHSEDEHVRMRAATFVINESKGRHDVKTVKNLNINVNFINEQMRRAREAKERARNKVIDVAGS